MIDIGPLRSGDRAAWEVLARGYKTFYRTTVPDEDLHAAERGIVQEFRTGPRDDR